MNAMRRLLQIIENAGAEDRFTGSTFNDDDGNEYSVERLYAIASQHSSQYLVPNLPLTKVEHDLEWWERGVDDGDQSHDHMNTVQTQYPILVLQQPDGHLTVCDGLNRMKKARDVEHRTTIPAYVIPWTDELRDACKVDD